MRACLDGAEVTHRAARWMPAGRRLLAVALSLAFLWVVPAAGATPLADHQGAAADPHGKSVRPSRPTALGPSGTATSAMPEFSWTRSRDATGYELVIHQGSHRILTKRGIHRLTWTSRVPLPAGVELTWRVRGLRNGKPGRYSFSQRFRIVLPDSAKAVTAFSFQGLSPPAVGTIDEAAHTIAVSVPWSADVTHLVATFATSGVSVSVDGAQQVSGETVNDFSHPVTYVVSAADGSTQAYVVTVTAGGHSAAKAITAFSFQGLSPPAVGTVDEVAHTIAVTVPAGADRSRLVATFVTTGVAVSVGGVPQTSGVTANDFTRAVTYMVTASDGSTQAYVVTVTSEVLSSQKTIVAFGFQGLSAPAVGSIDEAAHAIAVSVPPGTDCTQLVATFVTTGVAVSVGGTVQISGLTPNDFTRPVTYRVAAADLSAQDYVVTVTVSGAGPVKIGDAYQGGFIAYLFRPGDPGYVPR